MKDKEELNCLEIWKNTENEEKWRFESIDRLKKHRDEINYNWKKKHSFDSEFREEKWKIDNIIKLAIKCEMKITSKYQKTGRNDLELKMKLKTPRIIWNLKMRRKLRTTERKIENMNNIIKWVTEKINSCS